MKDGHGEPDNVLVMVKDERTCSILQEYLEVGGKPMLQRMFLSYLESREEQHQRGKKTKNISDKNLEL